MNEPVGSDDDLRSFLQIDTVIPGVTLDVVDSAEADGFGLQRVRLRTGDDAIPALLAVPVGDGPFPAVLALHQHAGQRHLGKSEVFGIAGDPFQAFGPALARAGIVVLAPDSIAFEDRRPAGPGLDPRPEDGDVHYNEMTHRLVRGENLMKKVLVDAMAAVSALTEMSDVDESAIGVVGHSYGGNTALFLMGVDQRIRFGCSSGALGSYRHKIANGIGLEMALVVPGIVERFDIDDVVARIAPRPLLAVSGSDDPYAADAPVLASIAADHYRDVGALSAFSHLHVRGGHDLDAERFGAIVDWVTLTAGVGPSS